MLSLSLPDPGTWPPPGPANTTLARCLVLALLVHLLAITLLGSVPGGSARPGQGVWGAINVTLRGAAPPARVEPAVPPAPAVEPGPPGPALAPRSGGAVREEAPLPAERPGAAREGSFAALPEPLSTADALPPTATLPQPSADLPPAAALPDSRAAEQRVFTAPAPLPLDRALPSAGPPVALPALPRLPALSSAPAAAPPAPPAPPALPAPPPVAAPAPAEPLIERVLALPRAAEATSTPALERPSLIEAPRRIEGVTRLPDLAPVEAPAPPPAPQPDPTPAATPAAASAEPAPAPPAPSPATRAPPPPAPAGLPDAGARVGHDVATPPSTPPSAPRLNLDLPRMRGGPISGLRSPGALAVMPRPPEVKDKLATDIDKAGKADCRTAYQGLGPLAVIPLAVDAVRKDGCKW